MWKVELDLQLFLCGSPVVTIAQYSFADNNLSENIYTDILYFSSLLYLCPNVHELWPYDGYVYYDIELNYDYKNDKYNLVLTNLTSTTTAYHKIKVRWH